MAESIQTFLKSVENNSLLGTLVGGGIIVTIFRYIGQIFSFISRILLNLISFEINERFDMQYYGSSPIQFRKLMYILSTRSKILWMKNVEVSSMSNSEIDSAFSFIPHGKSYHRLYGKFIMVEKSYDTSGMKVVTYVRIRVFFCTKKKFSKLFMADMNTINPKESNNKVEISSLSLDYVNSVGKNKRPISTIYNPDGIPQLLLDDVKSFLANERKYRQLDIPYKRNYLLYGQPGTGKTSCVMALASEIDWNIIEIDINKNKIDDIIRASAGAKNTIFLFEDIDSIERNLKSRQKRNRSYAIDLNSPEVTLGQILNLTDGLITPDKSISIFTTNHIEALDDAFLRDGRMDVKVEFRNFDWKTTWKMVTDKTDIDLSLYSNLIINNDIKPATLQENILKYNLGNLSKEEFIETIK